MDVYLLHSSGGDVDICSPFSTRYKSDYCGRSISSTDMPLPQPRPKSGFAKNGIGFSPSPSKLPPSTYSPRTPFSPSRKMLELCDEHIHSESIAQASYRRPVVTPRNVDPAALSAYATNSKRSVDIGTEKASPDTMKSLYASSFSKRAVASSYAGVRDMRRPATASGFSRNSSFGKKKPVYLSPYDDSVGKARKSRLTEGGAVLSALPKRPQTAGSVWESPFGGTYKSWRTFVSGGDVQCAQTERSRSSWRYPQQKMQTGYKSNTKTSVWETVRDPSASDKLRLSTTYGSDFKRREIHATKREKREQSSFARQISPSIFPNERNIRSSQKLHPTVAAILRHKNGAL